MITILHGTNMVLGARTRGNRWEMRKTPLGLVYKLLDACLRAYTGDGENITVVCITFQNRHEYKKSIYSNVL